MIRQPTLITAGPKTNNAKARKQRIYGVWDGLLDDLCGADSLPGIRDALFRHGYGYALGCLVVAVIVNHVRRILTPWLGGFLAPHAVADMKLARSAPHHFVAQSLEAPWAWAWLFGWMGIMYVLRAAWDPLTEMAARKEASRRDGAPWMVLWLVLALLWAEHAYVHSCWAAAQIYAHGVLTLQGTEAEQAFLQTLLEKHTARATVQLGFVVGGLHHWLVPMVMKPLRGRWAAAAVYVCVVGGTAHLVRYSNYYFVLLEMSDMLVTFGWFVFGLGVVGMEVWRGRGGLVGGRIVTRSSVHDTT